MGWCMAKKKKLKKEDSYIFLTGAVIIKNISSDQWLISVKDIGQQHKLSGKDIQTIIDNLNEDEDGE